MRSQFIIPCLAFAGLISPLATASATTVTASGYQVATRVVNFRDLNLNSREGVATLYSRIKSAAKEVCEPTDSRFVDSAARQRHCQERAIGDAVADAKSSQLLTFHMATTNQVGSALNR